MLARGRATPDKYVIIKLDRVNLCSERRPGGGDTHGVDHPWVSTSERPPLWLPRQTLSRTGGSRFRRDQVVSMTG